MTKPLMIAFGMALLATSPALAQKSRQIQVGFLSPLSGAFGILGAEQLRGTELALKTLDNKLGGRPGPVRQGRQQDDCRDRAAGRH